MGHELHEVIYKGLTDKELQECSLYDFSKEVFHRFHMLIKSKGYYIPYSVYRDAKNEIMDEIQKIYRIKTYGFNVKNYKE